MEPSADAPPAAASPAAGDVRAAVAKDPARAPLLAVTVLAGVAVTTAVGLFSYPSTLGAVRGALVVLHDLSGDLLLIAGVLYLSAHLRRTWRMKRRPVSKWSGYAAVLAWITSGATGIYGQLAPMPSGSSQSVVHGIASLALVVIACFHGAWGFLRPARRS